MKKTLRLGKRKILNISAAKQLKIKRSLKNPKTEVFKEKEETEADSPEVQEEIEQQESFVEAEVFEEAYSDDFVEDFEEQEPEPSFLKEVSKCLKRCGPSYSWQSYCF